MNYFIVGIKGTAMSNLAVILKQMGHHVQGTDLAEEFITDPVLKQNGIAVSAGFDPLLLPDEVECVVYSAAHQGAANPIVLHAGKKGVRTVSQAVLLGELTGQFAARLAVSGCHGKTTTTSLLAYTLGRLGKDPSYLVGTPFFNESPGGHYGSKEYFVIEADEYGVNPPLDKTPKLFHLHPTHAICTNIDFDHPDVYDTIEDTKKTFVTFLSGIKSYLCIDDPVLGPVIPQITGDKKTYGFSETADMRIFHPRYSETETAFELIYKGEPLGEFTINLFGEKNILNAAAVILLLIDLGFFPDAVREAVKGFSAVKRRFELVYRNDTTYLFDDYGHHPNEIAATIAAARRRFPQKRIIVLFQPHTYSRTLSLKNEFVTSLSAADLSLVAPIFASARENAAQFRISSADLEKAAAARHIGTVKACGSMEAMVDRLKTELRKGDVVFTVGAGDIYKQKDAIVTIISQLP